MTKKRNRYPGVYATANGWRYVIDLPPDGVRDRPQKSVSVDQHGNRYTTAKAASDARAAHIAEMAKRNPTRATGTVAAYLDLWRSRLEVRPATAWVYRYYCEHYIEPFIGDIPLAELHQRHILAWHRDLAARPSERGGTLSSTTVNKAHAILSQALREAVAHDLIPRNVAALVRPPGVARIAQETWTREQAATFLNATQERSYGPLWRLLLVTGMRVGEAVGLRWDDVDLTRGTVTIRRTMSRDDRGRRVMGETTKTPSSLRTIGIPPAVVAALRHQQDTQQFQRRAAGQHWQDGGWVFTHWTGRAVDPAQLRRVFRRDCTHAGVDPITLHALRHTAASLMIEAGESIDAVAHRLGHRGAAFTSSLYVHISVEHDQSVGERLEKYISGLR